jgi:hypothetical protein
MYNSLMERCPWMADYSSTLAASTQIIIFLKMLKFSKMIFLEEFSFVKVNKEKL